MHISTDIPRLAAECGVKEAEIPKILSLFHELGLLIHLTKTQKLAKIVVTRPQWLIEMLTLVLRDGELHKKECIEKVAVQSLENELKTMFRKGLCSRDLLNCLWSNTEVAR